jgi:hypothetical protein
MRLLELQVGIALDIIQHRFDEKVCEILKYGLAGNVWIPMNANANN